MTVKSGTSKSTASTPKSPSGQPQEQSQSKKRRRNPTGPIGTSSRKKKGGPASTADPVVRKVAQPPTHTLIIDNGGDTLKYGWSTDEKPNFLPNVTARLAHQITVLVGDELAQVQNPNSLLAVTRSLERGLISNMGNQVQVWKRLLDLMGVSIPMQSEVATVFGWKVAAARSLKTARESTPKKMVPSHSIAVVLLLPPNCPRLLLDQIVYVWMEDFGVAHVGFGTSPVCAAHSHSRFNTSCTVDLGWSSSLIVPTFRNKAILPEAVSRLPIGGRHLINMLKYYMSYRQYNLMDQEHLLRDVMEKLAFVSLDINCDLELARRKSSGLRPYDRDYVLPDYQSTHQGQIRLPQALQYALAKESEKKEAQEDQTEEEDEEDEDFEADHEDEDSKSASNEGNAPETENGQAEDGLDEEEEEETMEQRRQRILQQRAKEEMQRRKLAEEEQVLRVSVERFVVPEVLFRPSDAGLAADLVGLAPAIVKSIQACPQHFHPALYQSIYLVGGLCQIPNLKSRLELELRTLIPVEYDLAIDMSATPTEQAWLGAKCWITQTSFSQWSISREEWLASGKRKSYGRLLIANGGNCV